MGCSASTPVEKNNISPTLSRSNSKRSWRASVTSKDQNGVQKLKDYTQFYPPLTEHEMFILTSTWKTISENIGITGIKMFVMYV